MDIDRVFSLGGRQSRVEFISIEGVEEFLRSSANIVVCDENTVSFLPESDSGNVCTLKPGERHKQWSSVDQILKKAVELELGRDALFVGLGGGVVCDVTAFAASVYMRGCSVALVPTTLLAMVDASIGGKTGIDFCGYKNLVGSFHPADKILICFQVLDTLPETELKCGLGEVIKHALLGASDLFKLLENRSKDVFARRPDAIAVCVGRSLDVKGEIVESDFLETGVRAHLNLGHTFAHALESVSDLTMSHGEAVAWGISTALQAGVLAGITDTEYEQRVQELLKRYGFATKLKNLSVDRIIKAMRQDKKKREGKLRFILQRGLGNTLISELPDEIIKTVLA